MKISLKSITQLTWDHVIKSLWGIWMEKNMTHNKDHHVEMHERMNELGKSLGVCL